MTTFSELVSEAQKQAEADAGAAGLPNDHIALSKGGTGARAYGEAVSVYLAFAINKLADYNSKLCSWHNTGEKLRNTFSLQGISMVWTCVEGNPFCSFSGSYGNMLAWVTESLSELPACNPGWAKQFDAQSDCSLRNVMISCDPPYYNNVDYIDGKKYEQRRSQYQDLRRISDQLCREHALSVIRQPGGKKPRPLYEDEGQTRYEAMCRAIRKAISQSSTERDFARVLRQQGYLWRREEGRKYATLRSLDGGRAVRVYRLGEEYDWPALERVLAKNFARYGPHFYDLNFNPKYSLRPVPRPRAAPRRCRCKGPLTGQMSRLFRMYLYYCYQLGIYPKRPAPRVNWPEINALWRDIDKTLEELHLISERGFSTVAEVKAHREALAGQLTALCKERTDCARQLRWKEPPPGAAQRRAELTRQIAALRKEDAAAKRIIEKVEKTAACREEYRRQQERDKPRRNPRDRAQIR